MGLHILANAGAGGRVLEPLYHLLISAVVSPGRNECREVVEPRWIRISVGGDIDSGVSRFLDMSDDLGHAAPVGFAGGLEVPDFDRYVSLATDAIRLVERRYDGIALVSYVGSVDAAEAGSFGSKRDQLFSLGVRSGRILKGGRQADGAVFHGLADQFLHLIEFGRTGSPVDIAKNHAPDLGSPDVGREVYSDAALIKLAEVGLQCEPVGDYAEVLIGDAIGFHYGIVHGRG